MISTELRGSSSLFYTEHWSLRLKTDKIYLKTKIKGTLFDYKAQAIKIIEMPCCLRNDIYFFFHFFFFFLRCHYPCTE